MKIEQKAKAYDEALKKAKDMLSYKEVRREDMEYLFPELKESEGEKIRKWLIALIKSNEYGSISNVGKMPCPKPNVLTWLENQSESNPYSGTSFEYNGHTWGMCARDNGVEIIFDGELKAFLSSGNSFIYPIYPQPDLTSKSALEAVNEEKIDNINNVEPKFHEGEWIIHRGTENIYQVVAVIDNQYQLKYGDNYTIQKCADVDRCVRLWREFTENADLPEFESYLCLMFQKFRMKGMCTNGEIIDYVKEHSQKLRDILVKPAWSEEDVLAIERIIDTIQCAQLTRNGKPRALYTDEILDNLVNWLKSIKYRVQPKQEWSEGEKKMLDCAIRAVGLCKQYAINHQVNGYSKLPDVPKVYEELQDWLKSLKDRVQPQPKQKQEWNEEDSKNMKECVIAVSMSEGHTLEEKEQLEKWLKSLCHQKQCGYNPYKEVVESIAEMCKKYKLPTSDLSDFLDNVTVKCKEAKEYDTIFPQTTWKPSGPQIECLSDAIKHYNSQGYTAPVLKELLEQLKKIREE